MSTILPLYTPTLSDEKLAPPTPSTVTVRFATTDIAAPNEDAEDPLAAMRDQMNVWVDENETDGLPSATTSDERAEQLATSYTSGTMGFTSRSRSKGVSSTSTEDSTGMQEEKAATSAMAPLAGSGGILAALFALNAQSNSGNGLPTPLTPSSAAGTPTTPTTPTPSPGTPDDSDDELEREVWLTRRRAKRANAASMAKAARTAANLAAELAKAGRRSRSADGRPLFQRSLSSSNLAHHPQSCNSSSSPSTPSASQQSPSLASPPLPSPPIKRSFSTSTLHSLGLVTSRTLTPSPPPSPGILRPKVAKPSTAVAKQLRSLGGRLGLEVETAETRPDAARSGAGVFGGLVTSTVSWHLLVLIIWS